MSNHHFAMLENFVIRIREAEATEAAHEAFSKGLCASALAAVCSMLC